MPAKRIFQLFLGAPAFILALVSCSTMSVEEEFAEYEPIARSQKESTDDKLKRMFATADPDKPSAFDGKEFKFQNKEANLRSSFEKKEYADGDHPYFKLRKNGYLSDKKAFQTKDAPESGSSASLQGKENTWFSRVFSKKESDMGSMEVARKEYRISNEPRSLNKRNAYEGQDYPVKIIEDGEKNKRIAKKDLGSLLNSR